jgi:hypothetical protein
VRLNSTLRPVSDISVKFLNGAKLPDALSRPYISFQAVNCFTNGAQVAINEDKKVGWRGSVECEVPYPLQ